MLELKVLFGCNSSKERNELTMVVDLPTQALKQTSVPVFYLENITSLQQLIFFVHLAQREEFMAKQVGVMQNKLEDAVGTIKSNDQELLSLRKRFYVE
jgi:hypothetical protein